MITRAKVGVFKPKAWVAAARSDWTLSEPTKVVDALATPVWKEAMDLEFRSLLQNDTWVLVPPSPNLNVVGSNWVFRIKHHPDGSVQQYKARVVAKGFHQSPGIDYFETFSPVVKPSTIRVILSLAVSNKWPLRQLDFNNAFLNGTLDEAVFMVQPPGYCDARYPTYVGKLQKAIYGLKQAPRAWKNTFKTALQSWGFINSKSDTSLFFHQHDTSTIFLLVYVDDVIVTGSDTAMIDNLVTVLNAKFALKDLGLLTYFLGIQVFRLNSGLVLTQTKYIDDLLSKLDLQSLQPTPMPTVDGKHFSVSDGPPLSDPFLYRSTIGALQYLTHTRPYISYIVNHLSQFL